MGMHGAKDIAPGLTGRAHVIDITAFASHQIGILLPRNRLSDTEFAHNVFLAYGPDRRSHALAPPPAVVLFSLNVRH